MEAENGSQNQEAFANLVEAMLPLSDLCEADTTAVAADTHMQEADDTDLLPFTPLSGVDLPFSSDCDPLSDLYELDIDVQKFPFNVLCSC